VTPRLGGAAAGPATQNVTITRGGTSFWKHLS
jgi:hypothetical protein